jgi:ACS family tartrate transporter-like MFS transporter
MDGALGLRGWQWVFLIEAAPAVIMSFIVLRMMTDRPALAKWLAPDERQWIEKELDDERIKTEAHGRLTLGRALRDSRVIALSLMWMLTVTAGYGTIFFLPQIVKGLGLSNLMVGIASAIPYLVAMMALIGWGWWTDRTRERRLLFIMSAVIGSVGFVAAGLLGSSFWSLPAISLALAGLYGGRPTFWPLPSLFLSGTAAAGGIALINSIGNLGGYVGPFVVGWIKDSTNSFEMALYFIAGCSLASGVVAFLARSACGARPSAFRRLVETR